MPSFEIFQVRCGTIRMLKSFLSHAAAPLLISYCNFPFIEEKIPRNSPIVDFLRLEVKILGFSKEFSESWV
jgi:hypothetical protein